MSEILGNFNEDEFSVLEPKQTGGGGGGEPPEDGGGEPKEIPLKTKEDILKDLEKAGIDEGGEDVGEDVNDKPFDIPKEDGKEGTDKNGKPKDGGDKPDDKAGDKPTTKEGKKQEAEKLEEQKQQQRIEQIKAKNFITTKINQYEEILIKNADSLPNKVKNTLGNAIAELTTKRDSINI